MRVVSSGGQRDGVGADDAAYSEPLQGLPAVSGEETVRDQDQDIPYAPLHPLFTGRNQGGSGIENIVDEDNSGAHPFHPIGVADLRPGADLLAAMNGAFIGRHEGWRWSTASLPVQCRSRLWPGLSVSCRQQARQGSDLTRAFLFGRMGQQRRKPVFIRGRDRTRQHAVLIGDVGVVAPPHGVGDEASVAVP